MVRHAHLTAAVVVIVFAALFPPLSLSVLLAGAAGGSGTSTTVATRSPPPPARSSDPNHCGHGIPGRQLCPPSPKRETTQNPDPPRPSSRPPPVNHPSSAGHLDGSRSHLPTSAPPLGADPNSKKKGRSTPPSVLLPQPPPPPPRAKLRPVKPSTRSPPPSAAKKAKRDVGWAFLGVAILLQFVLGSYLAYKRRALGKVRMEKTPTSPPALHPAAPSSSSAPT